MSDGGCKDHSPGDCGACKRCPECGGKALLIGDGSAGGYWWCHDIAMEPVPHLVGCGWITNDRHPCCEMCGLIPYANELRRKRGDLMVCRGCAFTIDTLGARAS
jgi:hypothetical protein